MDKNTGVMFESVLFRMDCIEVSWTEERDRGDQNLLVRTRIVNGARLIPDEYNALIEAIGRFVDAAEVAQRLAVQENR
jgi:hypothetical protein